MAHNVASSPNGPRGDSERSHNLSDDIDNFLLLCPEHHKLVDSNVEDYPEEYLREMKEFHERTLSQICEAITFENTVIVILTSKIKGIIGSTIKIPSAKRAVIDTHCPATTSPVRIDINASGDYKSREYWEELEYKLKNKINIYIRATRTETPHQHFSVFPLAPIPIITKFGYLMGDKIPVKVYQNHRRTGECKWPNNNINNTFYTEHKTIKNGGKIALIISLTAKIHESRVNPTENFDAIYHIYAEKLGVNSISSYEDLNAFGDCYQETIDKIKRNHPDVTEICLYPAVPASAAFTIGNRYMQGVYPKIRIFDDDNGFFETIHIGEANND